jgi:hypothetical protein
MATTKPLAHYNFHRTNRVTVRSSDAVDDLDIGFQREKLGKAAHLPEYFLF